MAEEPEVQEEAVDPIELFTESIRKPVEGLMYLGQLKETVHFCGHTFEMKTLLPQDKFAISIVLQPYRNTIHEIDAYRALHVGMSITTVDGRDYCSAIGPDIESLAAARLRYVGANWYPPTVEYLWNRYVALEAASVKAILEFDRLSQGGQPNNLPAWLGSLIEQGPSPDAMDGVIPPSTPSK
jgi:hypothetical protein